MIVLLGVVGFIASTVVSALWRGYVLSVLWAWFMVTSLGLPPLAISQALGVSLIVGMLTHQITHEDDNKGAVSRIATATVEGVISPLLALGVGWVIKAWLP